MTRLLGILGRWLGRQFVTLLAIIAVLLGGAWLVEAATDLTRQESELARLKAEVATWEKARDSAAKALEATRAQRQRLAVPLVARLAAAEKLLGSQEEVYRKLWNEHPLQRRFLWTEVYRELMTRHAEKEATSMVVRALRETLRFVKGEVPAAKGTELSLDELDRRKKIAIENLEANRRARKALSLDDSWSARIRGTHDSEATRLDREYEGLKKIALDAAVAREQAAFQNPLKELVKMEADARREHDEATRRLEPTAARINELAEVVEDSTLRWIRDSLFTSVRQVIVSAILILLGVILTPMVIRALFFYVMAPAAAQRPAFRIDAKDSGELGDALGKADQPAIKLSASAVSIKVILHDGEQLVARSDFVQSVSVEASRSTCWFLDWRHWLTSIAAGLYALERVRGKFSTVTVSSMTDPLSEVARIDVPAGARMVFQPRCLVGVIVEEGTSPRIESRWRLASLHAWLTLQFRYLVFHGPVSIIARGCRGVRIERAGKGMAIDQSATLGFNAGLSYSNARSEPFLPYLRGERALFQDRFEGEKGFFIYEEIPRRGQRAGIAGKGLEGLFDAAMKILGI